MLGLGLAETEAEILADGDWLALIDGETEAEIEADGD